MVTTSPRKHWATMPTRLSHSKSRPLDARVGAARRRSKPNGKCLVIPPSGTPLALPMLTSAPHAHSLQQKRTTHSDTARETALHLDAIPFSRPCALTGFHRLPESPPHWKSECRPHVVRPQPPSRPPRAPRAASAPPTWGSLGNAPAHEGAAPAPSAVPRQLILRWRRWPTPSPERRAYSRVTSTTPRQVDKLHTTRLQGAFAHSEVGKVRELSA